MNSIPRRNNFGCLPVSVAIVLIAVLTGNALAQVSFPSESEVLRRLDSIESRLAGIEESLKLRSQSSVASQASQPSGFNLAPGERIVAVDGIPVGFPTLAAPVTRTTTITPRRYQESLKFNVPAYSSPYIPSYFPKCNGPDCR
jgi:hypothetical protein